MAGEVENGRLREPLENVLNGWKLTLKVWLIRISEGEEVGWWGGFNYLLQLVLHLG